MSDLLRNTFPFVLTAHGLVRWIVMVLMLVVFIRALMVLVTRDELMLADRVMGIVTVLTLDVQFLLGLVLVVVRFQLLPPESRDPLRHMEHPTIMFIAIVVAHVANVMVKKEKRNAAMTLWLLSGILIGLGVWRIWPEDFI